MIDSPPPASRTFRRRVVPGEPCPSPREVAAGDRLGWLTRWAAAALDAHRSGVPF